MVNGIELSTGKSRSRLWGSQGGEETDSKYGLLLALRWGPIWIGMPKFWRGPSAWSYPWVGDNMWWQVYMRWGIGLFFSVFAGKVAVYAGLKCNHQTNPTCLMVTGSIRLNGKE